MGTATITLASITNRNRADKLTKTNVAGSESDAVVVTYDPGKLSVTAGGTHGLAEALRMIADSISPADVADAGT